jgi:hypothetical protein
VITALEGEADYGGYTLLIHPDFIRGYPLGKKIKNYGFFSYAVTEALLGVSEICYTLFRGKLTTCFAGKEMQRML